MLGARSPKSRGCYTFGFHSTMVGSIVNSTHQAPFVVTRGNVHPFNQIQGSCASCRVYMATPIQCFLLILTSLSVSERDLCYTSHPIVPTTNHTVSCPTQTPFQSRRLTTGLMTRPPMKLMSFLRRSWLIRWSPSNSVGVVRGTSSDWANSGFLMARLRSGLC
jgi:hypothetical protein